MTRERDRRRSIFYCGGITVHAVTRHEIFRTSLIAALAQGVYEDEMTPAELCLGTDFRMRLPLTEACRTADPSEDITEENRQVEYH